MQIGVFGGSFDPPHLGHLLSALQLISFSYCGQVWFMPCFAHVWGKKLSPVKHRLAMTKLLGNKDIKVSALEIEQKRAMPTIETFKIFKKRYPQHQFFWVIGEKTLEELPKWKDYRKLIKNYNFLIVPEVEDISSSIIRERVKKGLSIKGLVPEKVEAYIKRNKLYRY